MATAEATRQSRRRAILGRLAIPLLAIFTALVVASLAMVVSGTDPIKAYLALGEGAFGSQVARVETLIKATPFLLAGLGIALAFRGGLFNIGVEGQLFVGSAVTVFIGFSVELPAVIHIPLALLGGMIGGAVWAAIPGYLKARNGAHEVITTIMFNFIALRIISWTIGVDGPLRAPRTVAPETPAVFESARLPILIPDSRLHAGVIIAVFAAFVVYWLLWRTVAGFELRTVGANPSAARYAGINVEFNIVRTMALSGALAGLGGGIQVLGLAPYNFTTGFNVGLGFDSIAVAVLGSIHPFGVALAALLFGAMDAGARLMQLRTKVPIDIVTIVQGLILAFVAADQIIRRLYRIRAETEEGPVNLSELWGGES
ncbi:MAG: ABC transporter permease [Chloroflexi bacterium]|nr:ABC transporter permease [Chloroflexota bacterium]